MTLRITGCQIPINKLTICICLFVFISCYSPSISPWSVRWIFYFLIFFKHRSGKIIFTHINLHSNSFTPSTDNPTRARLAPLTQWRFLSGGNKLMRLSCQNPFTACQTCVQSSSSSPRRWPRSRDGRGTVLNGFGTLPKSYSRRTKDRSVAVSTSWSLEFFLSSSLVVIAVSLIFPGGCWKAGWGINLYNRDSSWGLFSFEF